MVERSPDKREVPGFESQIHYKKYRYINMIGTWTLSSAVIGFLGFVGINTASDLKKVVLKLVGAKQDGIEIIQMDNDVEVRKNGKLVIKFDVDSISQILEDTNSQGDFNYRTYEEFITRYWEKQTIKPNIMKMWSEDSKTLFMHIKTESGENLTITIRDGERAYDRLLLLQKAYE